MEKVGRIREEWGRMTETQENLRNSAREYFKRLNEALRPAVRAEEEVNYIFSENREDSRLTLTLASDGQLYLREYRRECGGEWEYEGVDVGNLPIPTLVLISERIQEALEFFAKKLGSTNDSLDAAIVIFEAGNYRK